MRRKLPVNIPFAIHEIEIITDKGKQKCIQHTMAQKYITSRWHFFHASIGPKKLPTLMLVSLRFPLVVWKSVQVINLFMNELEDLKPNSSQQSINTVAWWDKVCTPLSPWGAASNHSLFLITPCIALALFFNYLFNSLYLLYLVIGTQWYIFVPVFSFLLKVFPQGINEGSLIYLCTFQ